MPFRRGHPRLTQAGSYETYLRRASRTPGALLIKEADIQDNYARLHLVQDQDVRTGLKTKYERALRVLKILAPAEGKLGFLRITVAVGEALVLCSEIDLQILVVERIKGAQINYRLQNQPNEVMSQQPFVIRVGGERVTMRMAIVGSAHVEVLIDALPDSIRDVREERITWPAVAVSELPDLPTPHLFHWSVSETIRFKGPDASTATVTLAWLNLESGKFGLALNSSSVVGRQLYQAVSIKLSGKRILLRACPGTTENALRLYVVAPPAIAVSS